MFIHGFLYENVRVDLIFNWRKILGNKGWISTHAYTLEHTGKLCLKYYIEIGLKSWDEWCSRSELDPLQPPWWMGLFNSMCIL
jgi:hypothetical protein